MEPLKFKTNIKCSACVAKVTIPLNETVGEGKWSVDLTNPSRILSVDGRVNETKMKEALEKVGYTAERL
jgi:copper chaperone CopZ